MTTESRVHAFVMAGGRGTRLQPLTDGLCKPALSFGGDRRVIDFVLANLRNSGLRTVDLLVQHEPQALIDHVQRQWSGTGNGTFAVRALRPADKPVGRLGPPGYMGTADAVFQNLGRAAIEADDLVFVFGADHVCRMDLRPMIQAHLESCADVTVAVAPVPLAEARAFGIIETDSRGCVVAFQEKPQWPQHMPARPSHALASMGNYLFRGAVLKSALAECCSAGEFDFGQHVLPRLLKHVRVHAFAFRAPGQPASSAHEESGYWRDVGTVDAYFQAQMDTLGATPRFALDSADWPLAPRGADQQPALVIRGDTRCSRLGSGATVDHASLDHAVIGAQVKVGAGARLMRSVVLDGVTVGRGARLRNVIVAEDNVIPEAILIGFDPFEDAARFTFSPSGVVVVPRGHFGGERVRQDPTRELTAAHG